MPENLFQNVKNAAIRNSSKVWLHETSRFYPFEHTRIGDFRSFSRQSEISILRFPCRRRLTGFFLLKTGIFLLVFGLLVYQEWFCHFLRTFDWPDFEPSTEDRQKILFVADPQLIGYKNEPDFVGPISRWDSDRYLKTTFAFAHEASNPDLIVFLGDLFDEGSTSSDRDFADTLARFDSVFAPAAQTSRLYIPGDNDVGGESFEPVKRKRKQRFDYTFKNTEVRLQENLLPFVNLYKIFSADGSFSNLKLGIIAVHNVLFSHFPILTEFNYEKILRQTDTDPSLIVSAHSHYAQAFKEEGKKGGVSSYSLNIKEPAFHTVLNKSQRVELQVPTCSYRMGVKQMGYAVLTAELHRSTGAVQVSFTVLWLQGRYPQLYRYLVTLVLIFLCVLCWAICRGH